MFISHLKHNKKWYQVIPVVVAVALCLVCTKKLFHNFIENEWFAAFMPLLWLIYFGKIQTIAQKAFCRWLAVLFSRKWNWIAVGRPFFFSLKWRRTQEIWCFSPYRYLIEPLSNPLSPNMWNSLGFQSALNRSSHWKSTETNTTNNQQSIVNEKFQRFFLLLFLIRWYFVSIWAELNVSLKCP